MAQQFANGTHIMDAYIDGIVADYVLTEDGMVYVLEDGDTILAEDARRA